MRPGFIEWAFQVVFWVFLGGFFNANFASVPQIFLEDLWKFKKFIFLVKFGSYKSDAELNACIFIGPEIRKIFADENFQKRFNAKKLET